MKICMVVNNILTEREPYTTTVLAHKMHNRKNEIFYMGIEDLSYYPEGYSGGRAVKAENKKFRTRAAYLENIKRNVVNKERVYFKDVDIVMLRNDPAEEDKTRAWARVAGISFGQMAM